MRAVLYPDYEAARAKWLSDLALVWSTEPEALCLTDFDYRFGDVAIAVHTMPAGDFLSGKCGYYWKENGRRVAQGVGRLSVHVMRVREGNTWREWLIPLRTETTEVHDSLKRIASASTDPSQIQEEVDKLVVRDDKSRIHQSLFLCAVLPHSVSQLI